LFSIIFSDPLRFFCGAFVILKVSLFNKPINYITNKNKYQGSWQFVNKLNATKNFRSAKTAEE